LIADASLFPAITRTPNPGDYVVRRAALQESDAVLAASRQDAVARRLHFHWARLAWNRELAERKTSACPSSDDGRQDHFPILEQNESSAEKKRHNDK
jgi:hypothetical protein